ncbi:MAG: SDR family NAD(P)-dependent oxidoreductase [Rhodospirillaceae bacterium]
MAKILWITGAGKGIGKAVALAYAAHGWSVAVSARTESDLAAVSKEALDAKLPGKIVGFPLDVIDHDAVKQTFKSIEADLGQIDQIIFNAGTHAPTPPTELSVQPFRTLMEVNYMGSVNGLDAVLPTLIDRKSGHVAIVASVAGYSGLPNAAAYGATKAALINMCESLKTQLDAFGVTISVINPGFVRTPLTDQNEFPMPFLMEPEDAAQAVFAGMEKGKFEISFPTPFVLILKFLRLLPYWLYFPLVKKMTKV